MTQIKSFKHIVFTTAIIFTSLLYSMEEKNPNANVDHLAQEVDTLSLHSEKPKKTKKVSLQQWWFLQENKSPFTVLDIDPYASKEEIHKALSRIPDNETDRDKVCAQLALTRHALLETRADSEIEKFRSKLRANKQDESTIKVIQDACKFMELYRVTPSFCIAFFQTANDIILKKFPLTTVPEKQDLMEIAVRQRVLLDKFEGHNISSDDPSYTMAAWKEDLAAVFARVLKY
jgi:hypothetical protein